MPWRYELTAAQRSRIENLLPGRKETVGRTAADNRTFAMACCGCCAPERVGAICRSAMASTRRCTSALPAGPCAGCGIKCFAPWFGMPTTNICCLTPPSCEPTSKRRRGERGADAALGRSRGGLTTKIHLLCNGLGQPVDFVVTAGPVADCTQALPRLGGRQAEAVRADKGYDADAIVQRIEAAGAAPVIPPTLGQNPVPTAESHRTLLFPTQTLPTLGDSL
jgi:Transposase DDE domain